MLPGACAPEIRRSFPNGSTRSVAQAAALGNSQQVLAMRLYQALGIKYLAFPIVNT
jgi:hypothetical protein